MCLLLKEIPFCNSNNIQEMDNEKERAEASWRLRAKEGETRLEADQEKDNKIP